MLNQWVGKILIEAIFTPVTYVIVGWLKQKEGVDTYDYKTNYNPFLIPNRG